MILSYIAFFLKSIHLHGVHSPFIFSLITKCLRMKDKEISYSPSKGISKKQMNIVLKMIKYFGVKKVFVNDHHLKEKWLSEFANTFDDIQFFSELTQAKFDMIFINSIREGIQITDFLKYMHNDSILIINNIHKKTNKKHWDKLVTDYRTTALVSMFCMGCAFVRKEQKKECFFVRV